MLPDNYEQILKDGGAIVENGYFKNAEQLLHDAEEHECCMMAMDDLGIPRASDTGIVYSLWGRIMWIYRNADTSSSST